MSVTVGGWGESEGEELERECRCQPLSHCGMDSAPYH